MLEYELSETTRQKMAANPAAVKAAIATIANQVFDHKGPVEGIGKYQGGVRVNNREIVIRACNVMDDWRRSVDTTPEERAVVNAIAHVALLIEEVGIDSVVQKYGECHRGDPLRSFLNLKPQP